MSKNELIGALDIGTYKTKFLITSIDEKNFINVHSKKTVHTQGIKKGNVVNIDKLIPIINTCVGQAEDEIKSEPLDSQGGYQDLLKDLRVTTILLGRLIPQHQYLLDLVWQ